MSRSSGRRRSRITPWSPEGLLATSFAALIVVGTALLLLPWSHRGDVGFLEALFTATSAVCVTGLVVVDTGTAYSPFGQTVILLLIQAGGLGVMSFAALAYQILGRRLSLRAQAALSSSMLQREAALEFRRTFRRILRFVLIAEAIGGVLLFIGMAPAKGVTHAACSAAFHSVSAFCNAGFSLYSDSLMDMRTNVAVISAVMALIVVGGIGHPVVVDLWHVWRRRRANKDLGRVALNSKVALWTSGVLIGVGALLLLAFGLPPAEQSCMERVFGALFQSVTARTAGFNTIDIGGLPSASLFLLMMLMLVGGSPGSCAGGIKTTTFALWLAKLWAYLRGEKGPRLFGRHVPGEVGRRVSTIVGLATVWNLAGLLLLLASERGTPGFGMRDIAFEQISAFGTVGLSTGLTPHLSLAGKLWIIATMFVGRLGPLTLAMLMVTRAMPGVRYPEGRIMIG
ncbi:MAG: ATPase [Vicinamibacteria bacterium]|nr:ATPase [Vicinamibacteria bacterium]